MQPVPGPDRARRGGPSGPRRRATEVMEIMQATLERTTGSKGLAMRSISAFFLLVGCTASGSEVRPPSDRIFFPTGAAVSPNETHLFVANGNSDLTFDSGSISVFALADLDDVIQGWTANA